MRGKMVGMGEEDGDGCDESVEVVCMWFVGRNADGDIHCRAGRRGNRKHHGRLIP